MSDQIPCPECKCPYTYPQNNLMVCPDCYHEWDPNKQEEEETFKAFDSLGAELKSGDSIVLTKDLKIKGATSGLKGGTKIKNIKVVDGPDNHNIYVKLPGVGQIYITSKFVKKA